MNDDKQQYNTARDLLNVIAIIAMTADHASTAFFAEETVLPIRYLPVLRELHHCDHVLFHRPRAQTHKIRAELLSAAAWMGNDI